MIRIDKDPPYPVSAFLLRNNAISGEMGGMEGISTPPNLIRRVK